MPAKRCSTCSLDYPNTSTYKECLRCGEDTWTGQNVEPMPADQLEDLKREVKAVKERAAGTNEQWLITYRNPQGQNPNGEFRTEVFYATAYDVDECRHQLNECKRQHGEDCGARAIVATGRPPKDGGRVAVVA